jgi:hypothetical protein
VDEITERKEALAKALARIEALEAENQKLWE